MPTKTALPEGVRTSLIVISEEAFANYIGVHPNTAKALRLDGTGPPAIALSPGRIGHRITDIQAWLDRLAREATTPTPEQRADAHQVVAGFVDALVAGDHARADELIPVNTTNVVAIEACGMLIRALRLSGRGAEIWQMCESFTNESVTNEVTYEEHPLH